MNLTSPQWDAVCAALSPKWPDEVCLIDLEFSPGRSQNWYRRRWGRGAEAVRGVVRDRSETGPRQVDPVELSEEVGELLDALGQEDLVGIADGVVDSLVVILGTATTYGIDIRPIWDAVHKANMLKANGPMREDGKRLKPEGWTHPDIWELLIEQGVEG